jgi:hypothetical protein
VLQVSRFHWPVSPENIGTKQVEMKRARHVLLLNDVKVIDVRVGIIWEDSDSAGLHQSK